MSVSLPSKIAPGRTRRFVAVALTGTALLGIVLLGIAIAALPSLALLPIAVLLVLAATRWIDRLCVLTFWALPYLILNLSLGGVTLKVPEVAAYFFTAAVLTRALLRREPLRLPPATAPVLLYLSVLAVSAALSPAVPNVFAEHFTGLQGADARSGAMLFWLTLSWGVVTALYHVLGTNPALFRRCVRAHILTGAAVSLIGLLGYAAALSGSNLVLNAIGNGHAFVYTGGSFYRLTGVSYEPLLFAYYLMTVIPTTVTVMLYYPHWIRRGVMACALGLQTVALLLTFSAGGWVALAVGLALLLGLLQPRQAAAKRVRRIAAAALALAGVGVGVFFVNPVISRTLLDAVGKISQGGYKMRDDENQTGLQVFYDYPVLGVGPGMVPFYFPTYHPTARSFDVQSGIYVNNLYITTLAETGVVGFLALGGCGLAGAAALARAVKRRRPQNVPVLTALCVSLIGCAIQYWETQNLFLIYFPVLVGLALAGAQMANAGAAEL